MGLEQDKRTIAARIGIVTKIANKKTSMIIGGGLLGSALKIWLILGCFPYRSTGVSEAAGALLSPATDS